MRFPYMSRKLSNLTRPYTTDELASFPRVRNSQPMFCTEQNHPIMDSFLESLPRVFRRTGSQMGGTLVINTEVHRLEEGDCFRPPGVFFQEGWRQIDRADDLELATFFPTITVLGEVDDFSPVKFFMATVDAPVSETASKEAKLRAVREALPMGARTRDFALNDIVQYGPRTLMCHPEAPRTCTLVTIETFFVKGDIHDIIDESRVNCVRTGPEIVYRPVYLRDF